MTQPNQYETREAVASLMVALANGHMEPDVRSALATLTDIPADRLDKATAEMSQSLPDLFALAMVVSIINGGTLTAAQALEAVPSALWKDDNGGTSSFGCTVVDPDTGNEASFRINRKIRP